MDIAKLKQPIIIPMRFKNTWDSPYSISLLIKRTKRFLVKGQTTDRREHGYL